MKELIDSMKLIKVVNIVKMATTSTINTKLISHFISILPTAYKQIRSEETNEDEGEEEYGKQRVPKLSIDDDQEKEHVFKSQRPLTERMA